MELLDTREVVDAYCYNLPAEVGVAGANPAYATALSQLVAALQLDPPTVSREVDGAPVELLQVGAP